MILEGPDWAVRRAAHEARVDVRVAPHLERRRRGETHPVHDFLFTYYSHSPAALRRWHPGFGVTLLDADDYAGQTGYATVPPADHHPGGRAASASERVETPHTRTSVTVDHLLARLPLVRRTRALLAATAARPPTLSCFGLHEWAMVHRSLEHGTRHDRPLRLGPAGTDAVVESHRIACSHFDAFRFFTRSARPLNTLSPGREDRADFEQPGCLHAGMDLYKHAFRLGPLLPSELVADCFELAWDIRVLDMRAAPYDLTGIMLDPTGEPWTPVRIETPAGKREYAAAQRDVADRGAPLRRRLIDACDRLVDAATGTMSA